MELDYFFIVDICHLCSAAVSEEKILTNANPGDSLKVLCFILLADPKSVKL